MNPPPAPDITRTQSGATIVKPVKPGAVLSLTTLLTTIGDNINTYQPIPFTQLADAHFLSWFVVPDDTDPNQANLYFELNVDGPVEPFLRDLIKQAGAGLDQIYGYCQGYPGSSAPDQAVAYLLEDNIGYDCYYIGWRGLTVERILRERGLRARLEETLDRHGDAALAAMPAEKVRELLQAEVNGDPSLAWAKTFPPRPFLVRYRGQVVAAIAAFGVAILIGLIVLGVVAWQQYGPAPDLIVVGVLAVVVIAFLAILRWKEATDSVASDQPDHSQVEDVASLENRVVQNHFASVEPVKPGIFRWLILKAVLKLIHVLAAVSLNQGNLSGITSIHFARWVVVDNGRRLLFLSNYDGSWENYLDDFIDRAHQGLTAIWSNTVGFPRTYFLINGGATDELLFKTITRESQVPSLAWYSAYPDLSIQNIQANAAIREGLFATMDAKAVEAWLALF
jgi:hypothetical protein